jgi:endoribonuclease Nob1
MKKQDEAILRVFDANIFLSGINFNLIEGKIYTTPNVIKEIDVKRYKDKNRNILTRIDAGLESSQLIVKVPDMKYIKEIERVAKETGDFKALSFTDREVLALALELSEETNESVLLYTDDYSMENVALELEIPFSQFFREGIKKKVKWEVFCPNCKLIYGPEDLFEECEICGTKLKRRAIKKKKG